MQKTVFCVGIPLYLDLLSEPDCISHQVFKESDDFFLI